jgi:hypothetical protein
MITDECGGGEGSVIMVGVVITEVRWGVVASGFVITEDWSGVGRLGSWAWGG